MLTSKPNVLLLEIIKISILRTSGIITFSLPTVVVWARLALTRLYPGFISCIASNLDPVPFSLLRRPASIFLHRRQGAVLLLQRPVYHLHPNQCQSHLIVNPIQELLSDLVSIQEDPRVLRHPPIGNTGHLVGLISSSFSIKKQRPTPQSVLPLSSFPRFSHEPYRYIAKVK